MTNSIGALYRSIGGTLPLSLVAPAHNPGVDFPADSWRISDLFAHAGDLYGWSAETTYLLKWNGSNAWVFVGKGDLNGGGRGAISSGGNIYCQAWARLYRWNGTTFTTVKDYGVTVLFGLAAGPTGKIYSGRTGGGGQLYQFDPGTGLGSEVAPRLNDGQNAVPILYNGLIYGVVGGNLRLHLWNGSNAWTQVLTMSLSFGSNPGIYSCIVHNDRIYTGISQSGGGALYSWATGETAFTLESAAPTDLNVVNDLFVHNNRIYGVLSHLAGGDIYLYRLGSESPGSSVSLAGDSVNIRPWPQPIIKPAILWTADSAGYPMGSDRGAAQDVYESRISIVEREAVVDAFQEILNANREGITLSNFGVELFGPEVNHSGSISATVVDFGTRNHIHFQKVSSLDLTFRALGVTQLGTTPSLASLRLQEGFDGDQSWDIEKFFTYTQAAAYKDFRADIGRFAGTFVQKPAEARAILAYLLVTARASAVALPTFPGVTYPFGRPKGSGPFNSKITSWELSRLNLNRWQFKIVWLQHP